MGSLSGSRIVVTRAAHQAEDLARPLRELGAEVILVPAIGIAPPVDPEPLQKAVAHASEYDWIIFTSASAVRAFAPETIAGPRIAVIGSATRTAAEAQGIRVDLVPERYIAEELIKAFESEHLGGKRILVPSAAVTRNLVPPALRSLGAQVDVVEAYRNVTPDGAAEIAQVVFRAPFPDWVTFASSSAVDHLVMLVGVDALQRTKIATIGPVTSETVRRHGLPVDAEAEPHTMQGLVAAICRFVGTQ